MKARLLMVLALAACCVTPALAQFGSVKGVCKDAQGKPIPGAVVEYHAVGSARTYRLKTDNAGEYSSLGVMMGRYNVVLTNNGQELFHLDNILVGADEKRVDVDIQHEEELAKQRGTSPGQTKDSQAAQQKQTAAMKALNEKLLAANQALQAGDFDAAIKGLSDATEIDATHDLLWAKLGAVYLASAPKQTDAEERDRRYQEAVNDYQKAIDIKAKDPAKAADPKASGAKNSGSKDAAPPAPSSTEELAGYYNNLAHAQAKSGKLDDAVKSYNQAIQLDPASAAQFYYNLGAVLMNGGKNDEAIAAFDKSIAADPAKPDAYYQKGVSLIAKATTDKNGKIVALPGTEEALNKYLELAPNGQFAEAAKGMIQYIGATVETNYNHPKKK